MMMGKTTVKKSQNKAANANIQFNTALSACIVRLPFQGRIRLAVVSCRVNGSGPKARCPGPRLWDPGTTNPGVYGLLATGYYLARPANPLFAPALTRSVVPKNGTYLPVSHAINCSVSQLKSTPRRLSFLFSTI